MADVNRAAYAAAHRLIASGAWIIDTAAGTITSRRYGKQLGCVQPTWGYVQLAVCERGFVGHAFAHRVIWEHANGRIPDRVQINHRNGIKVDNRLANLELRTPSGNRKHAFALGLASLTGSRNNHAALAEQDIPGIRQALAAGETGRSIAARYGVAPSTISKIRLGKRWQHVPLER